jgi:hypothetical protein
MAETKAFNHACVLCGAVRKVPSVPVSGRCRACILLHGFSSEHVGGSKIGMSTPTRLPRPTATVPGSQERVAELAARAARQEILWNSADKCDHEGAAPKPKAVRQRHGQMSQTFAEVEDDDDD